MIGTGTEATDHEACCNGLQLTWLLQSNFVVCIISATAQIPLYKDALRSMQKYIDRSVRGLCQMYCTVRNVKFNSRCATQNQLGAAYFEDP